MASKILDPNGNPYDLGAIKEPQTSRVAMLANTFVESNVDGITPSRAARILRDADGGNLRAQHILFDDIVDRDSHIQTEFGKRAGAVVLDWDIVPPADASAAEKKNAEWVKETLLNAVDDWEELLAYLMEAVGHGYAPVELEWLYQGGERIPKFHHRPQTWLRLDPTRRTLRLDDGSATGAELIPAGWILHQPKKVKTGYMGRAGLLRTLVWPFIYRAYSVGDFAEFLETYGLPIIVGKYFAGASPEEKASLFRAVTSLGHDARAIMPAEMEMEIKSVTGSAGGSHHMTMVEWAEKSISRAILGATLTSGADGKSSTNALGKVHNEVRHDIRDADARSLAATLTRDLVYPLLSINRGAVEWRRCPRLVFDTSEAEDITVYSEALPKLAPLFDIGANWARGKLRIPTPAEGEEVLRGPAPAPAVDGGANPPPPVAAATASLSATVADQPDNVDTQAARLAQDANPILAGAVSHLAHLVSQAESLEALRASLLDAYGHLPMADLAAVMSEAFAAAELAGLADVKDGN